MFRTAALQPEGDMSAVPLVAGLADPFCLDGWFIDFESQPVDRGTVEETHRRPRTRLRPRPTTGLADPRTFSGASLLLTSLRLLEAHRSL